MEWSKLRAVGKQTALSIDSTAGGIALTPTSTVHPVRAAIVQVYTAPIRFWVDGSAPTATTGHRADQYDQIMLENADEVTNFKGIRETGTSATVEVTYYA